MTGETIEKVKDLRCYYESLDDTIRVALIDNIIRKLYVKEAFIPIVRESRDTIILALLNEIRKVLSKIRRPKVQIVAYLAEGSKLCNLDNEK